MHAETTTPTHPHLTDDTEPLATIRCGSRRIHIREPRHEGYELDLTLHWPAPPGVQDQRERCARIGLRLHEARQLLEELGSLVQAAEALRAQTDLRETR